MEPHERVELFLAKHGVLAGHEFEDKDEGSSVFAYVGKTGMMICHPVGEPDTQSSWAIHADVFVRKYLD